MSASVPMSRRVRNVYGVYRMCNMTWHEAWDLSMLVVQLSLLMLVWAVTMMPMVYAIMWLCVTFLEER